MYNTIAGYGYTAILPPGFYAQQIDVYGGQYVIPPGSSMPPGSPAMTWIEPVNLMQVPVLQQYYYGFDNPMTAFSSALSLGLVAVLGIGPLRQTVINGASATIREFDAMAMTGFPVRMTCVLLQGPQSAVQVISGITLMMWAQFAGMVLQFLGGIQLTGCEFQGQAQPQTLVDRNDTSQVEMQLKNADNSVAPIMALPTKVQGQTVYEIHIEAGGTYIAGSVQGATVQFGDHNISRVLHDAAQAGGQGQ